MRILYVAYLLEVLCCYDHDCALDQPVITNHFSRDAYSTAHKNIYLISRITWKQLSAFSRVENLLFFLIK